MITPEHIQEFKETGLVVIENVLTDNEVEEARTKFHKQLESIGVNHGVSLSFNL